MLFKKAAAIFLFFLLCLDLQAQDIFQQPERGASSRQPAANWEHSLLSGNGTMGAMVMGKPYDETIFLSHALLYLPQRRSAHLINQKDKLSEIRKLILEGKYRQAAEIPLRLREEEGYTDARDPFIPAFEIKIRQPESALTRYQRSVNFETGEAVVSWKDDAGSFQRKLFVSRPDSVIVLSLKGTGKINCSISFEHLPVNVKQQQFINEHISEMKSEAADGQWLSYRSTFKIKNPGAVQAYEGLGRLITHGGSVERSENCLSVKNADEVLLLVKIDPLFNAADSHINQLKDQLMVLPGNYQSLLTRHEKVHGELFNRVKLNLFAQDQDRKLFNEDLLIKAKDSVPLALIERTFDAGRYNIISSTGTNPPNLQGLWSGTWMAPWTGGMTTDGNLPTAISANLPANMPELMLPYFNYNQRLFSDYKKAAKTLFDARGIHVPAQESTTGLDTDFGDEWCLTFWTGAAGWVSGFFWDYYQYTLDKDFLAKNAYPFMKEAAFFYEDFLTTGKDGKLMFNPSYSPENTPSNSNAQAAINATMDVMIARQLLRNCIQAAQILKIDQAEVRRWKKMLAKMPAYEINRDGALKEWIGPLEDNYNHRHASHLYALFDQVEPEFKNNPRLIAAANKVIEEKMRFRQSEGGGEMAFGLVQLASAATHIGQTEKAYQLLNWLSSRYWSTAMGSFHNVHSLFNTDISGGLPYIITQMLAYSEPGYISLLPALPKEWPKGEIDGLLLRGNIVIKSLKWDNKKIGVTFHSAGRQNVKLKLPSTIEKADGARLARTGETGIYRLHLPAGKDVAVEMSLK